MSSHRTSSASSLAMSSFDGSSARDAKFEIRPISFSIDEEGGLAGRFFIASALC